MRTLAWMARNVKVFRSRQTPVPQVVRRLVVTELGARNVEAALADTGFEETIIVPASPAEASAGLALRVAARIALVEQRGETLASATLVLGPARDAQTSATRELVVRTLATHLKVSGGGDLGLVAASAEDRDELLVLVDKLLCELDTREVTIRLQLRSPQRRAKPNEPASVRPSSQAS